MIFSFKRVGRMERAARAAIVVLWMLPASQGEIRGAAAIANGNSP